MTLGGSTESSYDYLIVNGTAYDGSLEGIVVVSTDGVITMSINSDSSVQDGPFTWSVVAECPTCVDSTVSLGSTFYSDGWYGATYSISDADGNVVASGPSDMGAWTTLDDTFCLEPGCYSFAATTNYYDDPYYGYTWSFGGESGNTGGSAGPISIGGAECAAVAGCTNANADNYNAEANSDDGSCTYTCPINGDGMNYMDGMCYEYVMNYGYTVDEMIGYGYDCSCVPVPVSGCMDASADNYNADATMADGSCAYTVAVGDEGVSGSYAYANNDAASWTFTGAEGNLLTMTMSGSTEYFL